MKAVLAIAGSLLLSTVVAAQETSQGQPKTGPQARRLQRPEDVAKAYVDATRAADWLKCAGFMHPAALKQVRGLLEPIVSLAGKAGNEKGLEPMLGIKDKAEFDRLNDVEVFARFLGLLTRVSPEMRNVLSSSSFEIIGQVQELSDLTHIVYRMQVNLPAPNLKEPINLTKLNVMTLRRFEDTWQVELSGDLRGVIQAMAANMAGALQEDDQESPPVKQGTGRSN